MSAPFFDHVPDVARRIVAATRVLVMLDYDGTLTPIVDRADDAHLSHHVKQCLQILSSCDGVSLAIVSGRALNDVQSRVGLPGLIYAGNHGLQLSAAGFAFVEPIALSHQAELETLCEALGAKISAIDGAWVERKGLTASVHYRAAAVDRIEELYCTVQSSIHDHKHMFCMTPGHAVYEIRPRVQWHKGAAAKWIGRQLAPGADLVFYVGDDVTDEDAFLALPDGVTIRVGESPITAARYHLRDQNDVATWLSWLARKRCSA